METTREILEEERKMRFLRTIVDLTAAILKQQPLSREEGLQLVEATKKKVLQLFPDKEAVYDLIYKPRFERLLQEFVWRREMWRGKE
jgi:hypothetical protein